MQVGIGTYLPSLMDGRTKESPGGGGGGSVRAARIPLFGVKFHNFLFLLYFFILLQFRK